MTGPTSPGWARATCCGARTPDGHFALVEHEIPPRALAAPTHVHEHEDEYSFVLSGRVGVQIGDEEAMAGRRASWSRSRVGIPHAFWNAGDEPARLLELISPAGFERYFEEMAPHLDAQGPARRRALGRVQARYGLTMDMGAHRAARAGTRPDDVS